MFKFNNYYSMMNIAIKLLPNAFPHFKHTSPTILTTEAFLEFLFHECLYEVQGNTMNADATCHSGRLRKMLQYVPSKSSPGSDNSAH